MGTGTGTGIGPGIRTGIGRGFEEQFEQGSYWLLKSNGSHNLRQGLVQGL